MMDESGLDRIGEGRSQVQEALIRMDEGEFTESVRACIRGASLALEGLLISWEIDPPHRVCLNMLVTAGRWLPVAVTSHMRHCCRMIDRYDRFYDGVDGDRVGRFFDEECAMELINYGREVLKFAQRNHRREDGSNDRPEDD
jgi:hypothetical protein